MVYFLFLAEITKQQPVLKAFQEEKELFWQDFADTESTTYYLRRCKELSIKLNPGRFSKKTSQISYLYK